MIRLPVHRRSALSRQLSVLMIAHHRRSKAQLRSQAMAESLVQRGHKVSLIVTSNQRRFGIVEAEAAGVHMVETPDLLWGRLRSGWDVWNMLNRIAYLSHDTGPYDLIHCFETRPATIYPALLYCRRNKVPFVTDWNDWWGRGGIVDELRPQWYRLLFGRVETYYEEAFRKRGVGVTVISTALAQRAGAMGIHPDHICHLPGGAIPEFFQARPKATCRERVGLDPTAFIIGFSSLDSHLDMELVLEALRIVAKRHPLVKLMITGKPARLISEQAEAQGVAGNLFLTGYLPYEELPWYLGCADLFVLPFPDKTYNVGRWPNKICEYMSLGRPTVSNPIGDVRTLFESHSIGLLAQWEPKDFAERIIYLLEHPEIAGELGENARNVAVSVYDWKLLIHRLEDFYHMLLNTTSTSCGSTS